MYAQKQVHQMVDTLALLIEKRSKHSSKSSKVKEQVTLTSSGDEKNDGDETNEDIEDVKKAMKVLTPFQQKNYKRPTNNHQRSSSSLTHKVDSTSQPDDKQFEEALKKTSIICHKCRQRGLSSGECKSFRS